VRIKSCCSAAAYAKCGAGGPLLLDHANLAEEIEEVLLRHLLLQRLQQLVEDVLGQNRQHVHKVLNGRRKVVWMGAGGSR
jgi:hypothetical protein